MTKVEKKGFLLFLAGFALIVVGYRLPQSFRNGRVCATRQEFPDANHLPYFRSNEEFATLFSIHNAGSSEMTRFGTQGRFTIYFP